ncbi:hypothetical protein [Nocardia mexicana]|uniref:hypothetical protein n=1 Tax=Nocardia mexicana TaxID=279262 RepID=UPI001FE7C51F|nr:hypothetical protein [Nocardia mexicana]
MVDPVSEVVCAGRGACGAADGGLTLLAVVAGLSDPPASGGCDGAPITGSLWS